jgi:hypothetical protein
MGDLPDSVLQKRAAPANRPRHFCAVGPTHPLSPLEARGMFQPTARRPGGTRR